jgi:hypothetical protein
MVTQKIVHKKLTLVSQVFTIKFMKRVLKKE